MCTGVEIALIGSALLGGVGSVATSAAQQKSAKRQADARNEALSSFLDKNKILEDEARVALESRLDQEKLAPTEAVQPLSAVRADAANAALDASSVAAPIPLGGNAPAVVANRAATAQAGTDAEARRRAAALADVRGVGDLLFEKGLSTQATGRDLGQINTFARANARLLPIQQDLAQTAAAAKGGGFLGTVGPIASALGTLGSTAAGAGVFGAAAGGGLTAAQRAANKAVGPAALFSPTPVPRPINLF